MKPLQQIIKEAREEFNKEFWKLSGESPADLDRKQNDFIEEQITLAYKAGQEHAMEGMIKLSDMIEIREPDGGIKEWMAFKAFRNRMRDELQALKK